MERDTTVSSGLVIGKLAGWKLAGWKLESEATLPSGMEYPDADVLLEDGNDRNRASWTESRASPSTRARVRGYASVPGNGTGRGED